MMRHRTSLFMGRLPVHLLAAALPLLGLACAASTEKPVDTTALRSGAKPGLAQYLAKVVPGAKLIEATPFSEGHMHETWKLTADVGGEERMYALKLFGTPEEAAADGANYEAARAAGWPVADKVHRGSAAPYKEATAYLSAFVTGRSLAGAVTHGWNMGKNKPADVAALYAAVGKSLGALHKGTRRPRKPDDISGAAMMLELEELCRLVLWCGPSSQKFFKETAGTIDGTEVTFIHGDLYETQMILNDSGALAKYLDLDESGYGDPAMDVGYLVAHILLINPIARQTIQGIPNPGADEQKVTAEAFLKAYKAEAGIDGPDWATFIDRVKAYMRLRVGRLMIKLFDNVHGKALLKLVDKKRVTLFVIDPFVDLGIQA